MSTLTSSCGDLPHMRNIHLACPSCGYILKFKPRSNGPWFSFILICIACSAVVTGSVMFHVEHQKKKAGDEKGKPPPVKLLVDDNFILV